MTQMKSKKIKVSEEMNVLDNVVFSMDSELIKSEESDTKGYLDVLSSYRNGRQQQTAIVTWNETLVNWKNYIENVTKFRSLPDCSGSVDCIEELNETLSKYYLALGNSSDVLNMVKMLDAMTSGIIALLTEDVSEQKVKAQLKTLSTLLYKTKDRSLLCCNKPRMLTSTNEEMKLHVGENIILHCNASSVSEIKYFWRKDRVLLNSKTSKDGSLVLQNVQLTDGGLYRCEATNHKGSTFSGITTIIVEAKPQIVEHPVAVQVQIDRESTVSFSCVASGKPLPTIIWLYRPPLSNFSVVLPDENSNILSVTPDNIEKSGYYYCEAVNTRGLVISREARLDIMPVTTANPKIAILFNVTTYCKQLPCEEEQAIPTRTDRILRNSVISMISLSLGVQSNDVTRFRLLRRSTSNPQIFLYASYRISDDSSNATDKELSTDQMLERFSETRIKLVGRLKRLAHALNKTILLTRNSSRSLIGQAETLGFLHIEPDCPDGQWLHDNGYFCVHCPPGSYKKGLQGACARCPVGTYQPRTGQTDCIPCSQHKTTLRDGTIHSSGCIKKEPGAPENLTVKVLSSTSIKLHWQKTKDSTVNHYVLEYRDIPHALPMRTTKVHPAKQSQPVVQYTLRHLDEDTEYSLSVYSVLGKKRGKPATVMFRTLEDVPAMSPQILLAVPLNASAVEVKWDDLPLSARNGIITSYTVYIKESASSEYINKQVGPNVHSTVIAGLRQHTFYCVRMTASTSKGEYPDWETNNCAWVKTKKIIM